MKIVIPGGSGHVGTVLARAFHPQHDVVVLSRTPTKAPWRVERWDGKNLGEWTKEVNGADVVINLAGRSVDCRYTALNRREIMESRVDSVHALGDAIIRATNPPSVWLQASTATIYAHTFDRGNDEATGVLGGDEPGAPEEWNFSIKVATAWEGAVDEFHLPSTRVVKMRSAMTMSPDRGSVFDTLSRLVRFGLGGTVGSGKQFVSWVHKEDFVRAVRFLIQRSDLSGVVNIASPNPLPYREFMKNLREAWGTRLGLPATEWMLEVGTFLLGTESELVLKSRRVIPGILAKSGFEFEYPEWKQAAKDLSEKWRLEHRRWEG